VATIVALYAAPPVASGNDLVVIEGGGNTVMVVEDDLVGSALEVAVTFTSKLAVTEEGAA
jgi:hypothetical protein